jgi:Tol biopolymer transport system component
VSDRSGRSAIYATDPDCAECGDLAHHIADLAMISTSLAWSPDGKTLAYTSAPGGVGSAIYVADLSCGDCLPHVRFISQPEHTGPVPAWSLDG